MRSARSPQPSSWWGPLAKLSPRQRLVLIGGSTLLLYCTFWLGGSLAGNKSWHRGRAGYLDSLFTSGRPYLESRVASQDHSPRCCSNDDCFEEDTGRHVILTVVRNQHDIMLLEELSCSVRKANPLHELVALTALGDLTADQEVHIRSLAELLYVQDPLLGNDPRWLSLKAWELSEYDAILLLDVHITLKMDISPVYQLPTDFATTLDQEWGRFRYSALGQADGTMIMLRPCPAVAKHMQALLQSQPQLHFANQGGYNDFLDWYFKRTRYILPPEWNALPSQLINETMTLGGTQPRMLRLPDHRPWEAGNLPKGAEHLCKGPPR
ncbi:hypothetical protein WJX74_000229 [Apatococcus lobatus]|uniref:Hexosyltransferase n=1 Tax=Apatococcus lobatus TaxID=904363 RepID=A0AAW1Q1K9_9CHLO